MHGGSGRTAGTGNAVQAQPSVLSLPSRWKGHQPAGAGLSNLGNSCYLNSTLQCLAYVPPLAHLCLGRAHSASCPRAASASTTPAPSGAALSRLGPGGASGAVPCTFCLIERQLAAQLRGSRAVAVSPSEVVRNLHLFSRSFVRGRQEDSHELLTAVLDVMEGDGRRAAVALGAPKGCRTIVEELFLGRWQSQVRCLVCGHESNTYESFATLPLDIGQARTVTEGLRSFTEAERLDGSNKYKCDKCRQLVPALKQTTIWDDPNVLVLHLKRFDAGSLLGKISRHVAFPEALDLGPHMTPQPARRRAEAQHRAAAAAAAAHGHHHANGNGSVDHDHHQQQREGEEATGKEEDGSSGRAVYGLTGVLVHQGTTLHSGHYYAFVRDSAGSWHCMNDSHVYGTSLDAVRQEQAYLLFYTRQTMKMPRPAPPPPPAAAPAQVPAAATAAAGPAPPPKVYGPQLPAHMARGSAAAPLPAAAAPASANGTGGLPPGGAGAGPLPQRPSRLNPTANPSVRLPAKVVISPRAAAAASAAAVSDAAGGEAKAAAVGAAAAAPGANGHAAGVATGVALTSPKGAAAAPAAAAPAAAAASAPEERKRKRAEGDGGVVASASGGAVADGEGGKEADVRSSVAAELSGLKACASWADGIKRLRSSVEVRLRDSGWLGSIREAVQGLREAGLSLQQVLALPREDPRRRALQRLVPTGVLQHGTDELRKLLSPVLALFAALGGPVQVPVPVLLL